MSEVLASSEEQQITECEEYTLCHGEATRKKAYTSEKVKKSMASMGTEWYQKAFAPGEASLVMADEKKKKLAKRAKERQQMQQRELDEDRLRKLCAAELAAAEGFQAIERSDGREQNVFSNLTRIGLLSAIQEASVAKADSPHVAERVKAKVVPGKPGGIAAALLLPASGFVNKPNARLMRRLVTALPRGSFGREILADSMVKAAEIWVRNNPTLTAREVQMRWAFKMLDCLRRLSQVPHLDSPSLCLLFGKIQVMQGSSSYCLGNISIARQLRHWVLKEARVLGKPQPKELLTKEEDEKEAEGGEGDAATVAGGEGEAVAEQEAPAEQDQEATDTLSGGEEEQQPQQQPASAKKARKPRSATVDPDLKIRLLHHYLLHAKDLIDRGRPQVRKQLKELQKTHNVMDNQAKTKLSDYDPDNLAKKLVFDGFKNQGGKGLLAFVDQQFQGREQSTEAIRSEIQRIMRRASDCKAGLTEYQPFEKPVDNLARLDKFKEVLVSCFDEHEQQERVGAGGEGKIALTAIKDYFAKAEKESPFSDAEIDACIKNMCDQKQLRSDGRTIKFNILGNK